MREKSGANLVKNLSGKDAFVSIDPSMLLKREDWDKLCSDNAPNEPYILLFTVPKPKNLVNYALELSEKHDCKVLFLNNFSRKIKNKRLTYIDPVSNNDFISLIKMRNMFAQTRFTVMRFLFCITRILLLKLILSQKRTFVQKALCCHSV